MDDIKPSPIDGGFGMLSAEEVERWKPVNYAEALIRSKLTKAIGQPERISLVSAAPGSNVLSLKIRTAWQQGVQQSTVIDQAIEIVQHSLPNCLLAARDNDNRTVIFHVTLEDLQLSMKEHP